MIGIEFTTFSLIGRCHRTGMLGIAIATSEMAVGSRCIHEESPRCCRLGKVFVGEVGVYTQRNPDRVRAADALFVSNDTYARRSDGAAYLDVAPELVVEILSPHDTVMDLTEKLREYFAIGVKLVWVPDPRARRVLAFRSLTDVRELAEADQLPGDDVLPDFAASVATLFDE